MNTYQQVNAAIAAATIMKPPEITEAEQAYHDAQRISHAKLAAILGAFEFSKFAQQEWRANRSFYGHDEEVLQWFVTPAANYVIVAELLAKTPARITYHLLAQLRAEGQWRQMVYDWYRGVNGNPAGGIDQRTSEASHIAFVNVLKHAFGIFEYAYLQHRHPYDQKRGLSYNVDGEVWGVRRALGLSLTY